MIKVAALTSGQDVPSTRFRVRQHIAPLRELGVEVAEYTPAIDKYRSLTRWPRRISTRYAPHYYGLQATKLATRLPGLICSYRSDVTWLERELLPGFLTLEPLLRRPFILDVDDAIWLTRPFGDRAVPRIAAKAAVVMAGNEYLAGWFSRYARDVRIVPTAVDTERFRPAEHAPRGRFVVGWTGSSGSLPYLEQLSPALKPFFETHRDAQLVVVADRPAVMPGLRPEQVAFLPWSPAAEVEVLRGFDVGLMPLPDDEWTRGKCSFKMLQYMACGIPAVVSPVGMNAEILGLGEVGMGAATARDWSEALAHFHHDRTHGRACGARGRAVVERHFSREVVTRQIAEVFRDLHGLRAAAGSPSWA